MKEESAIFQAFGITTHTQQDDEAWFLLRLFSRIFPIIICAPASSAVMTKDHRNVQVNT